MLLKINTHNRLAGTHSMLSYHLKITHVTLSLIGLFQKFGKIYISKLSEINRKTY